MATEVRSRNGCWTCRSRRKKCDESRPKCSQCSTRGIDCDGYGEKPSWMDGGNREKAHISSLKNQVANTMKRRRLGDIVKAEDQPDALVSLSSPTSTDQDDSDIQGDGIFAQAWSDYHNEPSSITALKINDGLTASIAGLESDSFSTRGSFGKNELPRQIGIATTGTTTSTVINCGATSNDSGEHPAHDYDVLLSDTSMTCNPKASLGTKVQSPMLFSSSGLHDSNLLLYYLEEVFPWQFRYDARPPLSKDWLLSCIHHSRPLHLAVLALSLSHMALLNPQKAFASFAVGERDLLNRYDVAIKEFHLSLQQDQYQQHSHRKSEYVLLCIIMLLFLNVLHDGRRDWGTHLQAGVSIVETKLEADLQSNYQKSSKSSQLPQTFTMQQIASDSTASVGAALGLIIWFHVLSNFSTVGRVTVLPQNLSDKYTTLLRSDWSGVNLENTIGCQNWVVVSILAIYDLRRWKKQVATTGSLSLWELVGRAKNIRSHLGSGIQNISMWRSQYENNPITPRNSADQHQYEKWQITQVFALAAIVLLEVVVSGAHPSLKEMEQAVTNTKDALQNLSSSTLLQFLTWPLCIAGCMARPELYRSFTDLSRSAGVLKANESPKFFKLMERCWWLREFRRDETGWDDVLESAQMDVLFI